MRFFQRKSTQGEIMKNASTVKDQTSTSVIDAMLSAAGEAQDALDRFVESVARYQAACVIRTRDTAAADGRNGVTAAAGMCRFLSSSSASVFTADAMAY